MPLPVFNMINKENNLKHYRERANVALLDVAGLLNIPSSNLARYESGQRNPTPEIILTYHILFGATLIDLLSPLVKKVKQSLVCRSQRLIEQSNNYSSPKSNKRITYLQEVVKLLSQQLNDHE
jgi:transcriptional regulator with XRE-family HTH domain